MSTDSLPVDVKFSLSWYQLLPFWVLSQLLCFMFFQSVMVHVVLLFFGLFVFNCSLFTFKKNILAAGHVFVYIVNIYFLIHFLSFLSASYFFDRNYEVVKYMFLILLVSFPLYFFFHQVALWKIRSENEGLTSRGYEIWMHRYLHGKIKKKTNK